MDQLPIVCSLPEAELSDRRDGLLARLMRLASDRHLLADGARLELPTSAEVTELLGQVLAAERQCCRFLRFRLDFEPDLGPIALEITGPPGTREFLEGTLGL